MKKLILVCFVLTSLWGQASIESKVLQTVQKMMKEEGRVTFSSLHNDPRFSAEERVFLERLYEILFAIPGFLRDQHAEKGSLPTRDQIASEFGVSKTSITLLLMVLETDPRLPKMFHRDDGTGEIVSIEIEPIDAFVKRRGQVQVRGWEGKKLPRFQVKTFTGETLANEQLLGKNSLLYFWFTGCPPCVRITPILADLAKEYQGPGFSFLGLNADELLEIDTTLESRRSYLAQQGIEFVNADLDATTRSAFGSINIYPTLFFVNKEGIVVRRLVNFQSRETLVGVIKEMQSQ